MSVSVQIQNVRLSPHSEAINFSLEKGENWALIGENSSGKTTLAKIIAGQVLVNGQRNIQFDTDTYLLPKTVFVAQRHPYKNLSNLNDFYYQQRFNSLENEDAETLWQVLEKITPQVHVLEKVLRDFELEERKNAPILQLSSGEHKRLQLAKVFVDLPQLLILDQPWIGLDIQFRKQFDSILSQATASGTQIITICAPQEIPSCVSKIAVMKNFKIEKLIAKKDFNPLEFVEKEQKSIRIPSMDSTKLECTNIIRMENIQIKYADKTIIKGLNWTVKPHEKWLISGKNGIGKSTLLSLITGDNPQVYSNKVYLFDQKRGRGESIWDVKKNMGYLSPELHAHFDKRLNVFQTISSGFFDTMGLYRTLTETQKQQVTQWINIFELDHQTQKPLHHLSHTTQRWVLLARALVKNPPLLILDEPCQGFSATQKKIFIEVIEQLCLENEKTIIYVSHYHDETPQHIEKKLIFNENFNYQIAE